MIPKTASAVAAPSPETKPTSLPSKMVRRTHMIPTGPTGTAITSPTRMPFRKNANSICARPRGQRLASSLREGMLRRNPKYDRCKSRRAALCYAGHCEEVAMTDTEDAYRFEFTSIDGDSLPLDAWRGRPVLVVNTASYCGYTPQYGDLQALWQRYRDRGLVVLGVPSNDFGRQEPGSTGQIKEFCTTNYSVDFPLTEKCRVIGGEAHPFYRWIAESLGEG